MARINTVLETIPKEQDLKSGEEKSEMTEKKEKKSSKKKGKKVDPAFVLFLNKYHKAIWAAKFNCKLVQEKEDDELEVCEEVCRRT